MGAWHVGGTFPLLQIAPVVDAMEDEPERKEQGTQDDDVLPEAPYFITISRKIIFQKVACFKIMCSAAGTLSCHPTHLQSQWRCCGCNLQTLQAEA